MDLKKLFEVFIDAKIDYHKENNLCTGKKIYKHFTLTRSFFPKLYQIIEDAHN